MKSVTDAIGLTNTKGEKAALKAGSEANAYAMKLAKENINFQKQQYNDWKAVYGSVQENLGSYFKSLTPERITAMGLEANQKEYNLAVADIKNNFATRNLTGSDLEKSTLASARLSNAEARATIRATAPDAMVASKEQFLSLGLGQGTALASGVSGAYQTGVNTKLQGAQMYMNRANQLGQANLDAIGDVVGAGFGWASGGTSWGARK